MSQKKNPLQLQCNSSKRKTFILLNLFGKMFSFRNGLCDERIFYGGPYLKHPKICKNTMHANDITENEMLKC